MPVFKTFRFWHLSCSLPCRSALYELVTEDSLHNHCTKQKMAQKSEGFSFGEMAESEGFEPPIPFRVCSLSRRVPSTARPALRHCKRHDTRHCNRHSKRG